MPTSELETFGDFLDVRSESKFKEIYFNQEMSIQKQVLGAEAYHSIFFNEMEQIWKLFEEVYFTHLTENTLNKTNH